MSYTKIWIHCVWTTANRHPFLTENIRPDIFQHILENSKNKEIYIDCINGYFEHIHCLISLKRNQNVAECLQLLKGESSFWINKNNICSGKFSWQDDYFAVSVSHSQVLVVRDYINRQEEHHKKTTFNQEYRAFIEKYGFKE